MIGIDVGGTFTDGVILQDGRTTRWVKEPTDTLHLTDTVLKVLDKLTVDLDMQGIKRIVLSTTLITNLLATGQLEKAALIIIPGPGLNPRDLDLADNSYVLTGAIDFRGREIEKTESDEILNIGKTIDTERIKKVAVVGKFSQRNPVHEEQVRDVLQKHFPHFEILMGHDVSGQLNFPRRAVTTYYTLVTRQAWSDFADNIQKAVSQRGIDVPLEVMKADGGTMSLSVSKFQPCQTVFSGPAASTMGAYGLTLDHKTSVVVDIGGTTSDLAFILEGNPLQASKGATIDQRYTHVKALAVRSIPLGGDSVVKITNGQLTIGLDRYGPAACLGGLLPTPTDAFNMISDIGLGDIEQSKQALSTLNSEVSVVAQQIIDTFVKLLLDEIHQMLKAWEMEPAYKVWEIVNRRKVKLERVIGIGAASPAIVPILAEKLGCVSFLHPYSAVGNALGAVIARPTAQLNLHADTGTGVYSIQGLSKMLDNPSHFSLKDAKNLAEKELEALTVDNEMHEYFTDREFVLEEQFNVVRGWSTTAKIFDVALTISPGVISSFKGVKA
ncbi:MAG: hydantoinase/oxoprolinase family protein [Ignavibacteriales bacterium]